MRAVYSRVRFLTAGILSSGLAAATPTVQAPVATAQEIIQIVSQDSRAVNPGAPANFIGHVQVQQLFGLRDGSHLTGGIVTFAPRARSVWHTHPMGQILIVIAGEGLVQQWGAPVRRMKAGDIVWIPAGIKHWHGASPSSSLTHIAIQEAADGKVVDWLEPVTSDQYAGRAAP